MSLSCLTDDKSILRYTRFIHTHESLVPPSHNVEWGDPLFLQVLIVMVVCCSPESTRQPLLSVHVWNVQLVLQLIYISNLLCFCNFAIITRAQPAHGLSPDGTVHPPSQPIPFSQGSWDVVRAVSAPLVPRQVYRRPHPMYQADTIPWGYELC